VWCDASYCHIFKVGFGCYIIEGEEPQIHRLTSKSSFSCELETMILAATQAPTQSVIYTDLNDLSERVNHELLDELIRILAHKNQSLRYIRKFERADRYKVCHNLARDQVRLERRKVLIWRKYW